MISLVTSLVIWPAGLSAAPLDQTPDLRGAPISQQFLASGASIVTTLDSRACVVSRRIGIEASVYLATDGTVVPFDQIRRSIAASVQAVSGADERQAGQDQAGQDQAGQDQVGFRIQLKFSPAPGTPILLTAGGQVRDLQMMLEPSTDSLWIDGPTASALQSAFAAGERPVLQSTSADNGHLVTDRLDTPDLPALAACQTGLASGPEADTTADTTAPALPLSNDIRVSFQADPATTPLATLPELRTCGMTDPPGVLHLARLDSVTGFFAQTDKVFVAFAADGTLAQVYIPGILDADFRDGGHRVRLSRAADSNLPTAQNTVKGCLGAATVPVCHYDLAGGEQLLGPCSGSQDAPGLLLSNAAVPPLLPVNGPPSGPPSGPVLAAGKTPDKPVVGGFTTVKENPPPPPPPPSPVPLPAPFLLLATAIFGLSRLSRLRTRGA